MGRKKSRNAKQQELDSLLTFRRLEYGHRLLQNLIRGGIILGCAYFINDSVHALAGSHTLADIGVSFLGKLEVSVTIAWMAATVGVVYGWKQRRLRLDTVERLQSRVQLLELQCDEKRTSSNLTPRGQTHPKDKL